MSGWVLFIFFSAQNTTSNIYEVGFFKDQMSCIKSQIAITNDHIHTTEYFNITKEKTTPVYYGYCIKTERLK